MLRAAPISLGWSVFTECPQSARRLVVAGNAAVNKTDMFPASQEVVSYSRKGSEKRLISPLCPAG